MAATDSGLRRVAVHTERGHADMALPSGVPVAALIAAIVDLLPRRADLQELRPYRLGLPGRSPLDGSKSLAQHGIRDGAVLALTPAEYPVPEPVFDDPAEQLAASARAAARPWTPAGSRLAAGLTASAMSGVAGFVAVPGGPGAPNAMLAVAAAGTVAALTVPSSGCGPSVRVTLCCLAGLAVLAAVAGMAAVATGISGQVVGAAAVASAVGALRAAGRIAVRVCGPSGTAHVLLTGLVAGSAAMAVLGAGGVAVTDPVPGVPRLVGVAFIAACGAALVLRARSHADARQIAALLAGGVTILGIAVLGAGPGPGQAATAVLLGGTALATGFAAQDDSALGRRAAEVLESLTLGALLPLACWVAGVYGAVRGLG
ncbi:EsaB/YukD family protein [Mycolicibacter sp. MYC123]|uniref:EsaB/YukD family protein n=1 Tax=[Mycobacterium] zoologicum TaxID=2872311 RepID=A0ABU5YKT8_9MYCO|nr:MULTISPECIES: EsaB/YukD family protein [unclassified Mycolicibacter]MEB3050520.1 EsaB/YukD family protein [Mycolicibacter sp. MYC123]MEB3063004.1 EsaB/YukD family protein [Mycolicibacter sp. MYC101]